MELGKYSFGIGDRFGKQGIAQLAAMMRANGMGIDITPVWNKSHREHEIIGTDPKDVREEADAAVQALTWKGSYFVDADHINMKTVDLFLEASDFFTIDVADYINQPADKIHINAFVEKHRDYLNHPDLSDLQESGSITEDDMIRTANQYLFAVEEAGRIYRYILEKKGADSFITEISMDETSDPQTPMALFFILAMIAQEKIPVQTIAPKFSGRFNKGVDYQGDVHQFQKEFEQDIIAIQKAVDAFSLPKNLKLSVHSGSDKFAIYEPIREIIRKTNAGIHIKTAGTTWLEELIGLVEAGGDGLSLAIDIYRKAYDRQEILCKPYETVIDIDKNKLPKPDQIRNWDSKRFASTLRHDPNHPQYNPHFRQLLHVGYKIAAEMGDRYLDALDACKEVIARNVTENLLRRHIQPIFLGPI